MQTFKSFLLEEGKTWDAIKIAFSAGVKAYKKASQPKKISEKTTLMNAVLAAKTPSEFADIAATMRLKGLDPKKINKKESPNSWLLDNVHSQKWYYNSQIIQERSSSFIKTKTRKLVGDS